MARETNKTINKKTTLIRDYILHVLHDKPLTVIPVTQEKFGVTRQTVHRHLKALVDDGSVLAHGETKSRTYKLATTFSREISLPISADTEEHVIWEQEVRPYVEDVNQNIMEICHHGVTEMLNNVIDHSESKSVMIHINRTLVSVGISIIDEGVGIFEKIQKDFGLQDQRQALLELSKGKLTSDSSRHSGEGIFFTSKMFDKFYIRSGKMLYACILNDEDFFFESLDKIYVPGTRIYMRIALDSQRDSTAVFNKYTTEDDDHHFSKTHVPVFLASYENDQLVSRSSAKRVLTRLNKFKEVWLDFQGVEKVGQAFADEIFRVYALANPDIRLCYSNANEAVESMIKRAISKIEPQ